MKTFFPPFVAFVVLGIIVIIHSFIFPIHVGDMGKGSLHAFMACFYYCWPLYFICALLTQFVVVIPVWEAAITWRTRAKDAAVFTSGLVCTAFAGGIAYAIWDKPTGYFHLFWLIFLMLMVQFAYWIINFFILVFFETGKVPTLYHNTKAEEPAE